MELIGNHRLRMLIAFPGLILLGLVLEKTVLLPHAGARPRAEEVAYWERHAQNNPDFAPSQVRLAVAYQGVGDWAGAERAYARALALDPDSEEAAIGRSGVLRRSGRRGVALAQLESFAEAHPRCAVCSQNLAAEYLALGRLDEAAAVVGRLLASDLTLTRGMYDATDLRCEAYLLAGRVYAAQGRHDRALGLFGEAARRDPADVRGPLFQARSFAQTGRAEAARRALDAAEARLAADRGAPGAARWAREIEALRSRHGS